MTTLVPGDLLSVAKPDLGQRSSTPDDLRRVLAPLDPITQRPVARLIGAALVTAQCADRDADTRYQWARYAYRSAMALWGPAHIVTVRASTVLQAVLRRQGLTFDAVVLCERRLSVLTASHRPGLSDQRRTTQLALAEALHADGQCSAALQQVTGLWRHHHGCGSGCRRQIALVQAVVLAGCGAPGPAQASLHEPAVPPTAVEPSSQDIAARWLARVEHDHPTVCAHQRLTPLPDDLEDRYRFWLAVTHAAWPGPDQARPTDSHLPASTTAPP